jgi:hypothetical protein
MISPTPFIVDYPLLQSKGAKMNVCQEQGTRFRNPRLCIQEKLRSWCVQPDEYQLMPWKRTVK